MVLELFTLISIYGMSPGGDMYISMATHFENVRISRNCAACLVLWLRPQGPPKEVRHDHHLGPALDNDKQRQMGGCTGDFENPESPLKYPRKFPTPPKTNILIQRKKMTPAPRDPK